MLLIMISSRWITAMNEEIFCADLEDENEGDVVHIAEDGED